MLLRRMAAHARSKDWFAAGMDLIIVILGVFIGIEVANWNQARQERQEERRYYGQLLVDLRTDLKTYAAVERRTGAFDQAAERVQAKLEGKPPADVAPGELATAIHHAGFIYLPVVTRGTYDELISTGNLGLLRDQKIKSDVAAYYGFFAEMRQWDTLLRDQQNVYWSETAGILPRHVLRAATRGTEPELSSDEERAIWQAAQNQPRLPNLLTGMAAHQERVRRDGERLAVRCRALIKEIEQHLADND